MIFSETEIPGAYLVTQERKRDARGFFARVWCHEELERSGLTASLSQASIAQNERRATLRGMHYQEEPFGEEKLVCCIRGAVFDVLVDLRVDSSRVRQWQGFHLSAENGDMLYVPRGVAHGYITLEDDTWMLYEITADYQPSAARGVRWDDPTIGISWPLEPEVISARDRGYPLLDRGGSPKS